MHRVGSSPTYPQMKQIIYNKDEAYQLVRVLKEDQLKNPDTDILRRYFLCDKVLRKQGLLYFCRTIEDIEYEESDNI